MNGAIFNQTVEILRAGTKRSRYSSETVPDWSNPTVIPVEFPVSVQPVGTTEDGVLRPTVDQSWRMYTPPGTDLDIRASDRVRLGGVLVMAVDGAPARWPDPNNPGSVHHVEVGLKHVGG